MEIKTKFNVDDIVYVCRQKKTNESESCKICDGKGIITIKGDNFICPKCNGNKYIHTIRESDFVPEEGVITKMSIYIENTKIYTKYECNIRGKHRNVSDYKNIIFATKEEAEARCKELNEVDSSKGSR